MKPPSPHGPSPGVAKASKPGLEELLACAVDPMIICDEQGRILHVGAAARELGHAGELPSF